MADISRDDSQVPSGEAAKSEAAQIEGADQQAARPGMAREPRRRIDATQLAALTATMPSSAPDTVRSMRDAERY